MAESSGSKRLLYCRFISKGFCRDRDHCEFNHDRSTAIPVPDNVCWYNLSNSCAYGANCRYIHMSADEIAFPNTSNSDSNFVDSHSSIPPNPSHTHNSPQIIDGNHIGTPLTSAHYTETAVEAETDVNSTYSCYFPSTINNEAASYTFPDTDEFAITNETTVSTRQPSKESGVICDQYVEETATTAMPTCKSYADTVKEAQQIIPQDDENLAEIPLCPYAITASECVFQIRGEDCGFLHGEMCDLCNCLCLHPYDSKQRKQHREDCIRDHEREMEISFAIKRSIDKACGICMDVIMEKEPPSERRFGILEKCSHIFCLSCIRKWRQTKQFDNKTIRACPECRVASDFVIPNKYWIDTVEEKNKLIESYKKNLAQKPCKYFKQGNGECPFAGACFYLHAYPDGTKAEMPPPRARRRQAQDGELETIRDMLLWNYLEARDDRQFLVTLDLEDMIGMHEMGFFSDSDDGSDYTDYLQD
ncbi:makorin-like protein [Dinothrombium tinctorium]|uniref:RING-type E3 ubiquitin transferase n=1 Tax=Dinothrombium tinctorium TaxID=1965070 RepID=A0A443RDE5_9ACAR|nr:makorin-like protein [Dinothrombium tinctorium]